MKINCNKVKTVKNCPARNYTLTDNTSYCIIKHKKMPTNYSASACGLSNLRQT